MLLDDNNENSILDKVLYCDRKVSLCLCVRHKNEHFEYYSIKESSSWMNFVLFILYLLQ